MGLNGTRGDIRVSAALGQTQMVPLTLSGAQDDERRFRPLEIPSRYGALGREEAIPGNIARMYARMARDLREGTRTAPSFADGVALHRLIATIEQLASLQEA